MTRPPLCSLAFALALGGLGLWSGVDLARESLGTSFGSFSASLEQRAAWGIEEATVRTAEQLGIPLEPDFEIYPALRDTPPEAFIFFLGDADSPATHNAYNHCEVLCYPRRFLSMGAFPEDWDPASSGLDEDVHLVGYESFRELDLSAWCDLVAEGQRFRLWRFVPGKEGVR